ncbi:MAG: hypothetical protein ACT4NY_14445 [Pseudonocardiales bacterium]
MQDQIRGFLGAFDAGVVGPAGAAVRASIGHCNRAGWSNAGALDGIYLGVNLAEAKQGMVPLLPGVGHFAGTAEPHEWLKRLPDCNTAYPHEPRW